MTSYKFATKINNGTIILPKNIDFDNQLVEITIETKENSLVNLNTINEKSNTKLTVDEFVKKYLGTMKEESEDAKLEYLLEKYK